MRAPSAGELLQVWEAGFAQAWTERALALLAVAWPEATWDTLAKLSIGQRDARLLELRERLWGPRMSGVVTCPVCRERLELIAETHAMLANAQSPQVRESTVSAVGYNVTFRLPTSADLVVTAEAVTGGGSAILERCILSVEKDGVAVDSDNLPFEVGQAVATSMAQADPLAEIQLSLTCPSCRHHWRAMFDIVSFLWTEIETWAWRILSDVHTLARAYGWCERDILALSPTRRQFYLDRVGA